MFRVTDLQTKQKNKMESIEQFKNKIIQGDCLEVMKEIPDKSVDMVLWGVTTLFIKDL